MAFRALIIRLLWLAPLHRRLLLIAAVTAKKDDAPAAARQSL
jgi:hypothetical protein